MHLFWSRYCPTFPSQNLLVYGAGGSPPDDFAIPLSKYGHLIPDVQPSNPQEVQRIVLFLAYLSRNPEVLPALAKLFDAKAEQIAAFRYSTELRNTMGEAVAKLSEITPAL